MTDTPHLISSNMAWHYRLITYVFTSEFFLETDGLDTQAMDSIIVDKYFKIVYKKKPKTVNLCPYCRAVVGAVIMFPFVVLYKLFPHKEKKRTHQEIMKKSQRDSKIVRIMAVSVMAGLAVWQIVNENYFMTAFYIGLLIFNMFSVQIIRWITKRTPKRKYKAKPFKEPPKFVKTISEKHDLICPPIFFVDATKDEDRT